MSPDYLSAHSSTLPFSLKTSLLALSPHSLLFPPYEMSFSFIPLPHISHTTLLLTSVTLHGKKFIIIITLVILKIFFGRLLIIFSPSEFPLLISPLTQDSVFGVPPYQTHSIIYSTLPLLHLVFVL